VGGAAAGAVLEESVDDVGHHSPRWRATMDRWISDVPE
jgi:hypothetical protein